MNGNRLGSTMVAFICLTLVLTAVSAGSSASGQVLEGFDKVKNVSTAHHPYLLFTKADLPAIRKIVESCTRYAGGFEVPR